MNYLVQRGKVRGQVIHVPEGYPELLSDITREVLRCQPTKECVCQFIIDYLHSIIVTRQKARAAKSIIDRALRIVDEVIDDLCICTIDKLKAEEMSMVMEECFKRFLEKRRCEARTEKEIVKFHEEDMLDELIDRCKFTPEELKITRPKIEEAYNRFVDAYMMAAEGTDGTEALYEYFRERERKRIEKEIRERAAIVIQSNLRGYFVRRRMFLLRKDVKVSLAIEELLDWDPNRIEEYDAAARKIQRFFRKLADKYRDSEQADDQSICSPKSEDSLETVFPPEVEQALQPEDEALGPDDYIPENPLESPALMDTKSQHEEGMKPAETEPEPEPDEPEAVESEHVAEAAEEAPPEELRRTLTTEESPLAAELAPPEEAPPAEEEPPAEETPPPPPEEASPAEEAPPAEETPPPAEDAPPAEEAAE